MKQQSREVYGFGARFRTTARFPSARVVLVLVIAGMLAGLLAGCDPQSKFRSTTGQTLDPVVYTDKKTGCEYLGGNSLTPRIDVDGNTHMGCGDIK